MFDLSIRKIILNKFNIYNEVFDDVPTDLIKNDQPSFNLKEEEGIEKALQATYESK